MNRMTRSPLCWFLAVLMAATPAMVAAQQPAFAQAPGRALVVAQTPADTTATKVDLSYIPPDAVFGAVAHPRRVLTHPDMQMLPIEVITAAGVKEVGFDPMDIEQAIVFVQPPSPAGPPGAGVALRLANPFSLNRLSENILAGTESIQLDGRPYRRAMRPMAPSFYMPDEHTLLAGTESALQAMLQNAKTPKEGEVAKLLSKSAGADIAAAVSLDAVRPLLNAQLSQMPPVPPRFEQFKEAPNLISSIEANLTFVGRQSGMLAVNCPDAASAEKLAGLIEKAMMMAREQMEAQMAKDRRSNDPVEMAGQAYARRMMNMVFDAVKPQRDGAQLRLVAEGDQTASVAVIGVLVALLLPAVQAAREAARRAQSINNMKQISIAMLNYETTFRQFPGHASYDNKGKSLLSWRVHLLPYLEEQALYKQFHLDEPWDSPHNKTLIDKMPAIYRNPSSPNPVGKSDYLVPIGEDTIVGNKEGAKMRQITDGTSNTILLLEVDPDKAVVWTKPEDLNIDMKNPLAGLGKAHPGVFGAAMADGSVHAIPKDIDAAVFRRMLQKSDGKVIDR